jgi:hypothetical protein
MTACRCLLPVPFEIHNLFYGFKGRRGDKPIKSLAGLAFTNLSPGFQYDIHLKVVKNIDFR